MTDHSTLLDQSARDQALDVTNSFIVQAPAGSGKTELLTLRYMKLLVTCEHPEEVLAITFTKKAASEMRDRIIRSLNWCQECISQGYEPDSEIENLRLSIGREVLAKDAELGWYLLDNPSRFRVQTIDSFCFYLAKQLPVLSQVGGDPQLLENIDLCFREAIRNTLAYLETDSPIAADIEALLVHLDNDIAQAEDLLANLLQQRDQWNNHLFKLNVPGRTGDENLEDNVSEWITESLTSLRELLLTEEDLLVKLFNHAIAYRLESESLSLPDFKPLKTLPGTELGQLQLWNLMLSFLMTQDINTPKWLIAAQAKHGFPAKTVGDAEFKAINAEYKEQRLQLIDKFSVSPEILESLNYIRLLPSPDIDKDQWNFLTSILSLLHHLSAELYIAMQQLGVVDYTQISNSAMLALGEENNPTDIAMALDHVIRHILVDEFQDTSYFQLILLEKLTTGWENSDDRSLFLVGDAMQSCYGFRNANVGIYLDVWENGLRTVALSTLRLTANFRSQANIVNWVNQVFGASFPEQIDISRGAVPYSPADAFHSAIENQSVHTSIITFEKEDKRLADQAEAAAVVARAQRLYQEYPDDDIAILVRNRSHLSSIVQGLREAELKWSATDIDRLNSLAIIDDLMAITRIILNPGDRLAWIAMLRAPWCGLGVSDLHALANHRFDELDIWTAIQQFESIASLSDRARSVLTPFIQTMQYMLSMRGRRNLRHSVEAIWNLLRGPGVCTSPLELESAQRFFSLLTEKECAGGIASFTEFEEAVNSAFVPSSADSNSSRLHLLTMHKAKGLEYDHVILPALNRGTRSDGKPLLVWHERLNRQGDNRLFMAGLNATGKSDSQLYQLLRHEQKLKNQLESTRLLYIAVTRAKKSAWLFASLGLDDSGELLSPGLNGLLGKIWDAITDSSELTLYKAEDLVTDTGTDIGTTDGLTSPVPIRRLEPSLRLEQEELTLMEQQLKQLEADDNQEEAIEKSRFELESLKGVLIHQCLEHYTESNDKEQFLQSIVSMHSYWQLKLRSLNLSTEKTTAVIQSIEKNVLETVGHTDLAWLFNNSLQDSSCELSLSRAGKGYLNNRIVDRSFVDSDDVRWIIDYKSSEPGENVPVEEFIEEQKKKYQDQLDDYEAMFQAMESRPIKKALLLTAIPQLVELR